ncbi:MAG: accessory gene regulator B family protein [Hungatella sp.]|nr:accessory gene regulator B family protein [Hungatella sp.]
MNRITELFISKMLEYRVINECDKNIYAYGIRAMIQKIIFTCALFLAAFLVDELIYTILFYISYKEIRGEYGTFHSKKRITCFGWTSLICGIAYMMKTHVLDYIPVYCLVLLMSVIFLMLILIKNIQNQHQKGIHGTKSAVLYIICLISCIFEIKIGIYSILMGFFCTVMLEWIRHFLIFFNEKNQKSVRV